MEENPILSRGGKANQELIDKMRAEQPTELQDQIPQGCLHCSTAWMRAARGRTEGRLEHCTGRTEIEIGGIAIMVCDLPESQESLEAKLPDEPDEPMGENLGENLGRPAARHANRRVKAEPGDNTYADLGELGEHNVKDLRFTDSAIQGFLTAYVRTRKKASEHKVVTSIVVSTVAIGLVTGSVRHFKHRRK